MPGLPQDKASRKSRTQPFNATRWRVLLFVLLSFGCVFAIFAAKTRAARPSGMMGVGTVTIASSSDYVSFTGDPVTFTATVKDSGGTPVTSGVVTFSEGATTLALNVPTVSGVASFTTSSLTEGVHTISVKYVANATYDESNAFLTQTVNNRTVVTGNQYCNPGPISMPTSGAGNPYPSNIFVSGLINPISKVTLSIKGLSHTESRDVYLLLVSPDGLRYTPMEGSGGTWTIENVNLVFDDNAIQFLPQTSKIQSGTYWPTTWDFTGQTYPVPAPPPPYQRPGPYGGWRTLGDAFNGTNASGTWKLYVLDSSAPNNGSINGGWCLGITTQKPNTTLTGVTTSPNPSVIGQSYTASATFSVVPPGSGSPTGTIDFKDQNNTVLCSATLPSTSCNIVSTTTGTRLITASYGGDLNFNGSSSSPAYVHSVNQIGTTLTIPSGAAITATPSNIGSQLFVDWNVASIPPGAPGPAKTGNVTVFVNAVNGESCLAPVGAGGCTLSAFQSAGQKEIKLQYGGDANYLPSFASVFHTVNPTATTTTITNAAALSTTATVVGQQYAVDVTVAPGAATGTVSVSDGTGGACTITLPSNSCTLTSTSPGTKVVTATYNGAAGYGTSSATTSHTVNKADTVLINITDSPDPTLSGQAYTVGFTLNVVAPGSGAQVAPSGTVSVTDGAGGACIATLPSNSCQLTSSTSGAKTLTLTYNGDSNFKASSPATAGHLVNKPGTTTTITAHTPNPSVFGQTIIVSFSVIPDAPSQGTATGNVVVTVSGGAETCSGTVAAGQCSLTLTALGSRTITAAYGGDLNYNNSTSPGVTHTVNKADSTTFILSDNPDSSALGGNVTVSFGVIAAFPGPGTPSGNVTVTVSGGAETCVGTVAAGSCSLALTSPGTRTITATYAGDANFNGSQNTESHTVIAPPLISKFFVPPGVSVGGTTVLTITLTNPAINGVPLTGVGVTDNFPVNLVVGNPVGAIVTSCGSPLLTNPTNSPLSPGNLGIKITNVTLGVGVTCSIKVNVTPLTDGPHVNTTGNVISTNGGVGGTATATLSTSNIPVISSKTLAVKAGSSAAVFDVAVAADADQAANTLGITINGNPTTASSNGVTVSGVTITPSGMVAANISTACSATTATFNLVVTDNVGGQGAGTLTIDVIANTPPVLTYLNTTVVAGTNPVIFPATGLSDNGSIASLQLQSVVPNNGGLSILLNHSNGQLTVLSASQLGSYDVTVMAMDICGLTTSAVMTIKVVCPTITFNSAVLPNAVVNTPYPQVISAVPSGNYTYSLTSGLLPNGLTLNSNGSFSGAPTQSGTFNFRVTASGFGGCTAFRDYVLIVECPNLTMSPSVMVNGTLGVPYTQTVVASPVGTYSYAVTSGALPPGLSLNSVTGVITGTVTASGSYSFVITATAGGCSVSRGYTVLFSCQSMTILTPAQLTAEVGVTYLQPVAVNPAGSYTFSLTSGTLPPGFSLDATTGLIGGLSSVAGSYSFTVKVLGAGGCFTTQSFTLIVSCPNVQPSPASLPNGTRGVPYSQTISPTSTAGPYQLAVTMGSLPPGMSLNSSTGLLNGTPTSTGTFNFRVTASGLGGCSGYRDYAITVGAGGCPTITLSSLPSTATIGVPFSNFVGASPPAAYSFSLTGTLPPGLTFYNSFGLIFGYPTTPGTYQFTISATEPGGCSGSQLYSVAVGSSAFSQSFGESNVAVVSAASYLPHSAAPGAIMAAFGENLAVDVESASQIPLPTELNGARVTVRDASGAEFDAPLLFVSTKQINFIVPERAAIGGATLTFSNGSGTTRTVSTEIVPVAPSFFAANDDGVGAAAGYFVRVNDGIPQIEEPLAVVDSASGLKVPAAVGFGAATEELFLVLSGTGLRGLSGHEAVSVSVGGQLCDVTYAGAHPVFVGLDQVNIRLPRSLAGRGEVEIEVLIDGRPGNILRIQLR